MERSAHRGGRRWRDLPPRRQQALAVASGIQLTLAVVAWADLARRARGQVRGPKWCWAIVIGINFVGPIAYFVWGVHRARR
ncbi:MAG TPA: PLD nuclease N-terminal domain-containing protein [Acidimicrobiales bacterium]|jgi:hypothetical protein|nr:PLD nuclease N-terminal domain-containing protein [Acidimicrobiales bacterium]